MKIAAGIVIYKPDNIKRFFECLDKILMQVEKVYLFDNGSVSIKNKISNKVVYITKHENLGIAYALNRIMEAAQKDGFKWLITMDQDSIIPDDMVKRFNKAITKNSKLGIVCPQVIDIRRSYMKIKKKPKQEYVDFCITSASCISIEAWKKIGCFDEWLFIDLIDNEFCKRLTLSGYKILRLNDLVLNQEFGKIIPKSEKIQKFWILVSKLLHNQNFAKFSYKKIVSPLRVYYTCRNVIYVNKKLVAYGPIAYKENYNCNSYGGFVISFIIPSVLRAQNKMRVIEEVVKGTIDGIKEKPSIWRID